MSNRSLSKAAVLAQVGSREDSNATRVVEFFDATAATDPAFGSRIRANRLSIGLSRHRLAKRAGLSVETVLLAERQPARVRIGELLAIAKALGVDLADLGENVLVTVDARDV